MLRYLWFLTTPTITNPLTWMSQGILVGQKPLREQFIHYGDFWRGGVVGIGELAAQQNRHAQSVKEVGANIIASHQRRLSRGRVRVFAVNHHIVIVRPT